MMGARQRLLLSSDLRNFIAPHERAYPRGNALLVVFDQFAKTIAIPRYKCPVCHRLSTKQLIVLLGWRLGPDELSCPATELSLGPSQIIQAIPDRGSYLWQRTWETLLLI